MICKLCVGTWIFQGVLNGWCLGCQKTPSLRLQTAPELEDAGMQIYSSWWWSFPGRSWESLFGGYRFLAAKISLSEGDPVEAERLMRTGWGILFQKVRRKKQGKFFCQRRERLILGYFKDLNKNDFLRVQVSTFKMQSACRILRWPYRYRWLFLTEWKRMKMRPLFARMFFFFGYLQKEVIVTCRFLEWIASVILLINKLLQQHATVPQETMNYQCLKHSLSRITGFLSIHCTEAPPAPRSIAEA